MKILLHIVQTIFLAIVFLAGCREDPEKAANKLFVEAAPLWEQYQALPDRKPDQYEARLKLLSQIDINLNSIVSDYPESSLAVELASTGKAKQIIKADVDVELPRLEQSIKATVLLTETMRIWDEYQTLTENGPAQYEDNLQLLSQVDVNLDKLLKEFPLSYEVETLALNVSAIKAEKVRLEESIPASNLLAEIRPVWDRYQALPLNDATQYETRLILLRKVDSNLDKLRHDFPHSYQASNKIINPTVVKDELHRLEQTINAAPVIAEIVPLWEQYQALPVDSPVQYEPRLVVLNKVEALLKKLPEGFDYGKLNIIPSDVKYQIDHIECVLDIMVCAISEASKAVMEIKPAFPRTFSLINLAEAQFRAGNNAGAQESLIEALEFSEMIKLKSAREKSVIGIARVKILLGDIVGAKEVLNKIRDDENRKKAILSLDDPWIESQDHYMIDLPGELSKAMSIEIAYDKAAALILVARAAAEQK